MTYSIKVIGRIVKSETIIDKVMVMYPNMGNFLLGILKESQDTTVTTLISLKNLAKHKKYHKNINPPELKSVHTARA